MRGSSALRPIVLLATFLLLGGAAPAPATAAAEPIFSEVTAVVGYEASAAGSIDALVAELGGEVVAKEETLRFVVVATEDPAAFVQAAQGRAGVRYAERDPLVFPDHAPNDMYYGSQWNMRAIHADVAWDTQKGDGAVVAVLDTGVDWSHPDLLASMWTNVGEVPLDGMDNDGNGYVDDLFGWDFNENNWDPAPGTCGDHGSHVAGIVAAQQDNVLGVSGVAPHTKIMALRVICAGNHLSAAALAVAYAANNGADVVTCSWWAGYTLTAFEEAVAWAYDEKNVLFVKSAGNQYGGPVTYPGNLPEYIAVSSVTQALALSSFSSVGAKVELAAPGSNVYSTYDSTYAYLSGTSMAAPHVAGAAALLYAQDDAITNVEVRAALTGTADDLGAAGRDTQFGFGLLDVAAAVGSI